ncbi:MAG: hypothetical protein R3A45_04090 [Bdellovibrionota bacterium]
MADVDLFSQFSKDRKYNNLAVQTLLQQVSDPVFDKCAHPEDTFEQGLQQIQMYYIHFSLIYAFLHNAKQYSSQDLTYCANLIHNLLQQYLALENENVTVIPEDPIATQEDDTEVDPNKAKQREEREKLILVFTSLSNSSFDIAQKIIIIFRNKQWAQKISDNSPEAILAVEKQAQISIDYFTNHIDVTVDHISDMDMILTRSTYELNQQEEAEEQPALPPVDLANKKTLRNLFILGFLVIVFMLSAWQSFTVPNFKSKYASQLHLPGLKITKINQSDDTLMVYAKTTDKTTLDRNYANMLEVEKNAYAFLDKNTKFRGIILFSQKKQLVKMFPRKFE